MAATLTGEARKLASFDTAKNVGFVLGGIYLDHMFANAIPVGGKTGWPQVGKLAAGAVVLGWAGGRFLGAEAGEALFTGAATITALEVVGVVSKGKYGTIPTDQPLGAANPQAALGAPAQALLPAGATSQVNQTGNAVAGTGNSNGYSVAGF